MKLERNFQINPAFVGVVPLINVMFLVILFFALSSRFLLQSGLAVSLPASSFTISPARQPQLVSIAATPVLSIYHGDRRIAIEELGPRLAAVEGNERSLVIKADRGAPYDLVINVMNIGLQHGYSIVLATAREAR
ncbi:MAG: biopolymer transporter ExbD [Chthoniobacteraceae bacterium]